MRIYHLNLIDSQADLDELKEKLSAMNIDMKSLNDLRFCPHFIAGKIPDDETWFADNTNEGYLVHLRQTHQVIDCETVEELIEHLGRECGNVVMGEKKPAATANALF